jgi:DNA-directed RNA polymerase subunit RPC12/RpoP
MSSAPFRSLHFVTTLVFFVTILIEIGFLICCAPALLASLGEWSIIIYTLVPFPIGVELWGSAHAAMTVLAIAVILVSFTWALLRPDGGFLRALIARKREVWSMGDLESVGMALMGALSVNFIIYLLASAFGSEPVIPEFPSNALHFTEMLFFASFWEELVIKLSFISFPLLLLGMMFRAKLEWWRYVIGGKIQMKGITVMLMILSAAIFGLAHVAGGWDWWKFVPTFIAGLLSAFLFIRFGLHASILFHFANNFLDVPSILGNNLAIDYVLSVLLFFFAAMGTIYWLMFIRSMFRIFTGAKRGTAKEGAEAMSPQGTSQVTLTHPTIFASRASPYICASCGNDEFSFSKGEFTCTRCGWKVGQPSKPPDDGKKDVMEL